MKISHYSLALLALAGCSTTSDFRFVAAEPLKVTPEELRAPIANKRDFLGSVAYESASKCGAFLSEITSVQASANTKTDIATTLLTALATVFTPVNTIHGLTAGSTVISGSKAAFNSNYFNKAGFTAFHVALISTYYKYLDDYLVGLAAISDADVNVPTEVTKIQTIHASCSLAATEASILATLQAPAAAASSPATQASGAAAARTPVAPAAAAFPVAGPTPVATRVPPVGQAIRPR